VWKQEASSRPPLSRLHCPAEVGCCWGVGLIAVLALHLLSGHDSFNDHRGLQGPHPGHLNGFSATCPAGSRSTSEQRCIPAIAAWKPPAGAVAELIVDRQVWRAAIRAVVL